MTILALVVLSGPLKMTKSPFISFALAASAVLLGLVGDGLAVRRRLDDAFLETAADVVGRPSRPS